MEEEASTSSEQIPRIRKKRKFTARIPPVRVKRVLQVDEEIGRMTASVPVVLGRAMEHFADRLLRKSASVAEGQGSRTLSIKHMKEAVERSGSEFAFLTGLVSGTDSGERTDEPVTSPPITSPSILTPPPTTAFSFPTHHQTPTSPLLRTTQSPFGAPAPDTNGRKKVSLVERKRRRQSKVEDDREDVGSNVRVPVPPPPIQTSPAFPIAPSLPSPTLDKGLVKAGDGAFAAPLPPPPLKRPK